MWSDLYEPLSVGDKNEFRRICNYLLLHTYLIRDVYRPDKQWTEPNSDYRFVSRMFACMRDYFAVSGWTLEKDDTYGVISLSNIYDHNRIRLNRFTTLFLYVCRLIYEEGREQGDNLRIVHTDTAEVVEKMRFFGLLDRGKTTIKERFEAQSTLAHYNIIQKTDAAAWRSEGNDLLIMPSILSLISGQSINELMKELEELRIEDSGEDYRVEDRRRDFQEEETEDSTDMDFPTKNRDKNMIEENI